MPVHNLLNNHGIGVARRLEHYRDSTTGHRGVGAIRRERRAKALFRASRRMYSTYRHIEGEITHELFTANHRQVVWLLQRRVCPGAITAWRIGGRPCLGGLHAVDERRSARRDPGPVSTDMLRESPELASGLGVSEAQAGGRYIDRLSDVSRDGLRRQRGIAEAALAALGRLDRASLCDQDG